ncbi:MAG: AraC family transcriptional regulator [Pseudomonadota bacterium]
MTPKDQIGHEDDRIYPTYKALSLIRGMAGFNVHANQLIEGSGLDIATLDQASGRISLAQLSKLYANAAAADAPADRGLRLGATMSPTDYGPYGYAIMTAATFEAGLQHMSDFLELETPVAELSVEAGAEPGLHAIRCDHPPAEAKTKEFVIELYLSMVFHFAKQLHGESFRFTQVQLGYAAPAHAPAFDRLFECPCLFNAERNAVLFPSPLMHQPMRRSNPITYALMREQCEEAIKRIRGRRQFATLITGLIEGDARRFSALEGAADALGLSARTLQRRLINEGTTFKDVVEQARIDLAIRFLRRENLDVEEVAWRLGYANSANFRTAFKRWTGQTIRQFLGTQAP